MKRLKASVFVYILLLLDAGSAFHIIDIDRQMLYEYVGTVAVGAKSPQEEENPGPPTSGWIVRGKLTLQRQSAEVLAAALVIDDVTLNNSGENFLQNKEMFAPYKPFKIVLAADGTIKHLIFKENDPIWSTNFKRAIASILQFQMKRTGAYVVNEIGIHGECSTEYFVSSKTNYVSIRKTPELTTCKPFAEAIHVSRSNVSPNICENNLQKSVIIGNEAIYGLLPHNKTGYFLSMAHVKGTTLIHTFESTGEAQYINSELLLNFLNETILDNRFDIETSMSAKPSSLELEPLDLGDPTGGRYPQPKENLVSTASSLLNRIAESLESTEFKYGEPYDTSVSDLIKVLSEMDFDSLKSLYTDAEIGTSYRQETLRNIFHEIIPRIGTKASVMLTRYLIVDKNINSVIAVQLLMPMPFHIFELSHELIKVCENFLTLGPEYPNVRNAAILSFATLVYNVYVAGGINRDVLDEYVEKYFNLYLASTNYEQKMVYLQGLSNLQLGNVANYLDPIVTDDNENEDLKFLAAWTTMSLAAERAEKIYEIYWPIFESRNASIELRVAAVTLLLISNPTPARLISIHHIIQSETDPHMINYYRTTVTSISETTYPCYRQLRRLLSYMQRHLPQKPESRYWVTGNYVFDYRDSKYGIGAMLQAFLIGDNKADLPVVAYFKFDTEALGKFTGQFALYIKARGLPDAIFDKYLKNLQEPLRFENIRNILKMLQAPVINSKRLHLEIIIQMEGKNVLLYYWDQSSFNKLTDKNDDFNVLARLNQFFSSGSHINMQTIRWPFMTKYYVPTVLGTSADILLQTTVLTSVRGNITHNRKVSFEMDTRYTSYASCRSRSYNPFLNLDHEINREQALLVHIPLNNDLSLDGQCVAYAFTRPEKFVNGLSFKSRSVTSTTGFITKSSKHPIKEIMYPESRHDAYELFKIDIKDLGITMAINTNLNDLNKYRGMLLKSEFMENGFSRNRIINSLMYIFGVSQLSSIHLGHDRNLTLLVYNDEFTNIEGSFCLDNFFSSSEKTGKRFNISLQHSNDINASDPLNKLSFSMDVMSSTKTTWFEIEGKLERNSKTDANDWMACINITYVPLVFTKRPHTLTGDIVFGSGALEACPTDASHVSFAGRAGPSDFARDFLLSENSLADNDFCPKEVLKFSPIPTSKYCKRCNFENFTTITDYDMALRFENMPEWFELWSTRLDHFVSVFSEHKVERMKINEQMNFSLHIPNDNFWVTVGVNGVNMSIYHIPLLQKLDSKYDATHELSYDSGWKRSCSIINGMVNTFDDYLIMLSEYYKIVNKENCQALLVADCSPNPEMAVFLLPNKNTGLKSNYGLKVHIGQHYFSFAPTNGSINEREPVYITLNEDTMPIDVRQQAYQYPANADVYDFRIEINEQNIMIVENTQMHSTIQFDMLNIFNFEIYGVYKNKMCGMCSNPFNTMANYTLCT